jgi:hypothetical protein
VDAAEFAAGVGLVREDGAGLTAFAEGELPVVAEEGAGDDGGKYDDAGTGWELMSVEGLGGFAGDELDG